MKLKRKAAWKIAAATLALLCVVGFALVAVLQSEWFRNEIRNRIILQVEKTTGGKVEINGFDYDWRKLTADLTGFVIHGTEKPPADPLFRVERAQITVRVLSVLERSADVSSIVLTRPQVSLTIAPDGSTNLPTPPVAVHSKDPIAELFALKLNHFVITNGLAVVNDQRIPLNVHGDGVEMAASYLKAGPSYDLTLSSRQIDLAFGGGPGLNQMMRGPLQLNARASIGKDRVLVQKVELLGATSHIVGSAMVEHFARPSVNFQVDASTTTNEVLPLVKFSYVRDGKLGVRGTGHYDQTQGWSFDGKAEAQQVRLDTKFVKLAGINGSSDVEVRKTRTGFSPHRRHRARRQICG